MRKFDDNFDRKFDKLFWPFFAVCAILGIALTCVVIWAIIELVSANT